jgi:hypothetical protein
LQFILTNFEQKFLCPRVESIYNQLNQLIKSESIEPSHNQFRIHSEYAPKERKKEN